MVASTFSMCLSHIALCNCHVPQCQNDVRNLHPSWAPLMAGITGCAEPEIICGKDIILETQLGPANNLSNPKGGKTTRRTAACACSTLEAKVQGMSPFFYCFIGKFRVWLFRFISHKSSPEPQKYPIIYILSRNFQAVLPRMVIPFKSLPSKHKKD